MIDVLTVENDKSEKVTIENPILSNTDDEFPTIDIISPLKSPVKSASVAQDVDKPLKPIKYVIDEELQHTDHLFLGVACFTFMNFV